MIDLKRISWTNEIVEEWLIIAAKVERTKPSVRPQGYKNCTLLVLRNILSEFIIDPTAKTKFKPTQEQISIWEIVILEWNFLIDSKQDQKIIWLHANGMGWTKIGKINNLSRQTAKNHYLKAIDELRKELCRKYSQ